MRTEHDLSEYRGSLKDALGDVFLRGAMDAFAVAYRGARARAFSGMDVNAVVDAVAQAKDASLADLDGLYARFKAAAEAKGVKVHLARSAREACTIIEGIARAERVKKIVKSKSMTAEEIHLNHALEEYGYEIVETDLGEWIIQLRKEGPSHMVMPAIHLSRFQVADLFTKATGQEQEVDIQKLVKVARRELRRHFATADMGISGANFAIAESGAIGIVTNEGNGRLVTTLPRVHVALVGLEKLCEKPEDALAVLTALPKNATGQAITSYVTWMSGRFPDSSSPDGKKIRHIVFLDNGRSKIAKDPVFKTALRCIRCGACANVCPIYRLVGGHRYGHVYIGAIGLVLTYFFHGSEKAKLLVQNCLNCQACKAVCAAGIDLPRLIKEVHAAIKREEGPGLVDSLFAQVMKNRTLFQGLLRSAALVRKPLAGDDPGFMRHLPMLFMKGQDFRALPTLAKTPFRDLWDSIKREVQGAGARVGFFSGCVQDFVYPEQALAAVKLLSRSNLGVEFPKAQTCCGLPALMMGEQDAARDVARLNIDALYGKTGLPEHILTLCASCASHLKHSYPTLLEADPAYAAKAQAFADRVIDFPTFAQKVLGLDADAFNQTGGDSVAYHAPCHLCRGMGVDDAPRELLKASGATYLPADEEDVCCGFGGSFSVKFPELSAELLNKKLANLEATGATVLATDCPGCILQLKGGLKRRNSSMTVKHTAEILAERLK